MSNARCTKLRTRVDEHLVELIDRGYDGLAGELDGSRSNILGSSDGSCELVTGYLGCVGNMVDDFIGLSCFGINRCLLSCSAVIDGCVCTISDTIDCLVSRRDGVVDGGASSIVDGKLRTSEIVGGGGCGCVTVSAIRAPTGLWWASDCSRTEFAVDAMCVAVSALACVTVP